MNPYQTIDSMIRPEVVAEIAGWWRNRLDECRDQRLVLLEANIEETQAHFRCSPEEAIRGLCVGEQLHWRVDP